MFLTQFPRTDTLLEALWDRHGLQYLSILIYVKLGHLLCTEHKHCDSLLVVCIRLLDEMDNLREKLTFIRSLGCKDETLCYAAYRVYVHLTVEKNFHDVQYHYVDHLRVIYLTAKKEPELAASLQVFIPALATEQLDFSILDTYRKIIKLPNGVKVSSIILAICDSSSTVLLYKCIPALRNITEKNTSKGKLERQQQHAVKRNE